MIKDNHLFFYSSCTFNSFFLVKLFRTDYEIVQLKEAQLILTNLDFMVQETLYNVWDTTLSLWDSVINKRINLQQLKLQIQLNLVLNKQVMTIILSATLN